MEDHQGWNSAVEPKEEEDEDKLKKGKNEGMVDKSKEVKKKWKDDTENSMWSLNGTRFLVVSLNP
jgi:hypothetical protein